MRRRRQRQLQIANLLRQNTQLYERCVALEAEKNAMQDEIAGLRTQVVALSAGLDAPRPWLLPRSIPDHRVPARLLAALNSVPAEGNVVRFGFGNRERLAEVIAVVGGPDADPGLIWDYIRRTGGLSA